jgi:hypothetical protein
MKNSFKNSTIFLRALLSSSSLIEEEQGITYLFSAHLTAMVLVQSPYPKK